MPTRWVAVATVMPTRHTWALPVPPHQARSAPVTSEEASSSALQVRGGTSTTCLLPPTRMVWDTQSMC